MPRSVRRLRRDPAAHPCPGRPRNIRRPRAESNPPQLARSAPFSRGTCDRISVPSFSDVFVKPRRISVFGVPPSNHPLLTVRRGCLRRGGSTNAGWIHSFARPSPSAHRLLCRRFGRERWMRLVEQHRRTSSAAEHKSLASQSFSTSDLVAAAALSLIARDFQNLRRP